MTIKMGSAFLSIWLVAMVGAGAALASGNLTVSYKVIPSNSPVPGTKQVVTPCGWSTLGQKYLYYLNPTTKQTETFEFMFWNENGNLVTTLPINFKCTANSSLTGWYMQIGDGGPPCTQNSSCTLYTYYFSLASNGVIPNLTPIGTVSPSPLWTPGSTTVSTITSASNILVTPHYSGKFGPFFQKWIMLGATPSPGPILSVSPNANSYAVGVYGATATPLCHPKPGIKNCT